MSVKGLSLKEIKELKEGNTIKVINEGKRGIRDEKGEYKGKFVGLVVDRGRCDILFVGYKEGEYKLSQYRHVVGYKENSGKWVLSLTVTRSRLTGKTSEAVNKYYQKYILFERLKRKEEENRRKAEEKLDKLRSSADDVRDKESKLIEKENYEKLSNEEKLYKELMEYDITNYYKVGSRSYGDGSVGISKSKDMISVDFSSDTYTEGELKYLSIYLEYDYTPFLTDASEEKVKKEVEHLWGKFKVHEENKLKGLADIDIGYDVQLMGHKLMFEVSYNIKIKKKLNKDDAKYLAGYINHLVINKNNKKIRG